MLKRDLNQGPAFFVYGFALPALKRRKVLYLLKSPIPSFCEDVLTIGAYLLFCDNFSIYNFVVTKYVFILYLVVNIIGSYYICC